MQGLMGCCQVTLENAVPARLFCFQKLSRLVSDGVFSTTFSNRCQSFPIKTPVLTEPKYRNGELCHESPRKPRSLLESASSRASSVGPA